MERPMSMRRSVLFVSTDEERRQEFLPRLRAAGWLPLFVPSIERARASLTQLGVDAFVLDVEMIACTRDLGGVRVPIVAWFSQVLAAGIPAGIAAVICEPCEPE